MPKYALSAAGLGLYVVAALLLTTPVALQPLHHMAGTGGDPWQTMWRFADTGQRLQAAWSAGQLPSFITLEFLNGGPARLINLSAWPWMWLYALAGLPLAYNLIWLASFVLSGFAMYLLLLWLFGQNQIKFGPRRRHVAAWLGGLMYMMWPFRVAHSLGHFGAMQTMWLPLLVLLLFITLKHPTAWRVLGLAILIAVQTWTEHHYALWFAFFVLLTLAWQPKRYLEIIKSRRGQILAIVFILTLAITVILPLWPTVRLAGTNSDALNLGQAQTERFSADLMAPLVPASFHTLWGRLSNQLFAQSFTGNVSEATLYIGWVPLLLIIFFNQRVPKNELKFWWTAAAVFFVISLGPTLHVFGRATGIPLPYALISWLPVISSVRTVARAAVIAGLAVSVIFGWVMATQVKRGWVAAAAAVMIALDFLSVPIPTMSARLSPVYDAVTSLPGKSIVEIPAATNYAAASRALYASTIHGKEVVGDIALERGQDAAVLTEVRSLPALRQLLYLRTNHVRDDRTDFFEQSLTETLPDVLEWLGVGAIVVHKDSLSTLQRQTVSDFLEQDMKYRPIDFDDVVLYQVAPAQSAIDEVFLARDSRWEHVGYDSERNSVFGEVPNEATVTLYNSSAVGKKVQLTFSVPAESNHEFTLTAAGQSPINYKVINDELVSASLEVPAQSKLNVVFKTIGSSKLIIQNPHLVVSSL